MITSIKITTTIIIIIIDAPLPWLQASFAHPALPQDRFLELQARLRTALGPDAKELQLPAV